MPAFDVSVPFTSGSSLQQLRTWCDSVGDNRFQFPLHRDPRCNPLRDGDPHSSVRFSSLYIGILAATEFDRLGATIVAVFQFPLHRDPRCNNGRNTGEGPGSAFQFPLHRDPRCNRTISSSGLISMLFQFPLHRDPRCNRNAKRWYRRSYYVSVPFTSGSSLQRGNEMKTRTISRFQFPLHRDPRCNSALSQVSASSNSVSVPFTSGSSLQL